MRRLLSFMAASAVAALVPLCLIATWAEQQILNTDAYVDTVAPLASNKVVLNDVADKVTESIRDDLHLKSVLDGVLRNQPGAQKLVSSKVDEVLNQAVTTFLESPQFRTLWEEANRKAHEQVVALLHGDTKGVVKDGRVVLDLTPMVPQIEQALASVELPGGAKLPVPDITLRYDLFDAGSLGAARDAVNVLQKLTPMLLLLAFAFALAAVLLHPRKLRGGMYAAIGLAIGGGLLMLGVSGLSAVYGSKVAPDVQSVSQQVYDTLTRDLFRNGVIALGVGIAVALICFVSSFGFRTGSSKPESSGEPLTGGSWDGQPS